MKIRHFFAFTSTAITRKYQLRKCQHFLEIKSVPHSHIFFQRFTKLKSNTDDHNQSQNHHQQQHRPLRSKRVPRRIRLFRPVRILNNYSTQLHISTGLTFDDGDQLLVSAQKPLGMVLEESDVSPQGCVVVEVLKNSAAEMAGVKIGDILVAVQNADVSSSELDQVLERIRNAPRVVNLRFWRKERRIFCEGNDEL